MPVKVTLTSTSVEPSLTFSGVDPEQAKEALAEAQMHETRIRREMMHARQRLIKAHQATGQAIVLILEACTKTWPRAHRYEFIARLILEGPGDGSADIVDTAVGPPSLGKKPEKVWVWTVEVKFKTQVDGAKRLGESTWQRLPEAKAAEAELSKILAPWGKEITLAVGTNKSLELPRKTLGQELAKILLGEENARAWQAEREAFMLERACKAGVKSKKKKAL